MSSDGKRKPNGLFFGEFIKSNKTAEWVGKGKATIDVLPMSPSELEYKNKLSVLHATHQTIFRIVPNQIGISAAFSGEQGFAYYFETSGKLMVSGKLVIVYKKNTNTYDERHSVFIDGIANIIIRNEVVILDLRRGEIFLDETLPHQYREQMSVQFPNNTKVSQTEHIPESLVETEEENGIQTDIPIDSNQCSQNHEFMIYYFVKNDRIVRPNATLVGKIVGLPIVYPIYEKRRNEGIIRTVLFNPKDDSMVRESKVVKHSSDLITVSANNSGVIKLYGETSGGFAIKSGSVLKINGLLIINRNGKEDQPIGGINFITVNSGSVSLFICDNNHIILLDEGNDNYIIETTNSVSQQTSQHLSNYFQSPLLSPILTPFGIQDTVYGSALDLSSISQRNRISPQSQSMRSQEKKS